MSASKVDLFNLEAWAIEQGYDPAHHYNRMDRPAAPAEPYNPDTHFSAHFSKQEMSCNCCGELAPGGMPFRLFEILETMRAHFGGKPVAVTSGYRCPKHNENSGGVEGSRHTIWMDRLHSDAADFKIAGVSPREIYEYLDYAFGDTIGLHAYDTFTHVDARGHRARW